MSCPHTRYARDTDPDSYYCLDCFTTFSTTVPLPPLPTPAHILARSSACSVCGARIIEAVTGMCRSCVSKRGFKPIKNRQPISISPRHPPEHVYGRGGRK